MRWSTPADLRGQVQRLWDRGAILAGLAGGESPFPRRLVLKAPSSTELLERFDEARAWTQRLCALPHLRLELREIRHRVLGANSLPAEAWVDDWTAAVALIGKEKEAKAFLQLLELTEARRPALREWLARRPLRALELAEAWPRLLDVVDWIAAHPRPGIFLRQIDLPGVHSKWVEAQRGVLGELLDLVLPPGAVDPTAAGAAQFLRRYGFRDKPERIRMRVLDPSRSPFPDIGSADITLDAGSFARLRRCADQVFITENEINFLAFPELAGAIVIFGAGYGFEALARAQWLEDCYLRYWGDIDTHGFAILSQLRGHFRHVESFLMDRRTLMAFEPLWGTETSPTTRDLPYLTAEEQNLYDDLRDQRIRPNLRLEQERIGFNWVLAALGRSAGARAKDDKR